MDSRRLQLIDAHYRRSVVSRIKRKKALINKINDMCHALAGMRDELDEMILQEKTEFRRFDVGFSNDAIIIEEDDLDYTEPPTVVPVATWVQPSAPPYKEATCSSTSTVRNDHLAVSGNVTGTNPTVKKEDDGFDDTDTTNSGDSDTTLDLMQ